MPRQRCSLCRKEAIDEKFLALLGSAVRWADLWETGFGTDAQPGPSYLVGEVSGAPEKGRCKRRSSAVLCGSGPHPGSLEPMPPPAPNLHPTQPPYNTK